MGSPLEIKDLGGLAEPTKKLIESISSAVGALYEPKRIRKRANAEADSSIIKANAESQIDLIRWQSEKRIQDLELRRQLNIDQVIKTSISLLPEQVSKEKVDEDWIFQFFNYCQDFSDEKTQRLWSKILAGEITKPGSYSLMTLNYLRMMPKWEAELLQNLRNFILGNGNDFILLSSFYWKEYLDIKLNVTLTMQSHGILIFEKEIGITFNPDSKYLFKYGNHQFGLSPKKDKGQQKLELYPITDLGNELLSLCDFIPNDKYLKDLFEKFTNQNLEITIFEPS